LRGLFTGRLVLPILDGLKAGLHKNGMSADGLSTAHAAVWSDYHFDFDFAADVHPASELRVSDRGLSLALTLAFFIDRLRTGQRQDEQAPSSSGKNFSRPIESDVHHNLPRRKTTPRRRRQVQCQGRRGKINCAN